MPTKLIPEHIDPYRFADQNLSLDGVVSLANMRRLPFEVDAKKDKAEINITFGVDEQKTTYITGKVAANVTLQCQRCLKPLSYEIMSDFVLGVVNTLDQARKLPKHYEPVIVEDGKLALHDLVEDELLLNLPIIPRHDASVCSISLPDADGEDEEEISDNPFLALAALKQKQ